MITPLMFLSRLEDLFNKIPFHSILLDITPHTLTTAIHLYHTIHFLILPAHLITLTCLTFFYLPQSCITLAISHAMARDGSSGGVIRLVTIDKDGVEKEVILGKNVQAYLH